MLKVQICKHSYAVPSRRARERHRGLHIVELLHGPGLSRARFFRFSSLSHLNSLNGRLRVRDLAETVAGLGHSLLVGVEIGRVLGLVQNVAGGISLCEFALSEYVAGDSLW